MATLLSRGQGHALEEPALPELGERASELGLEEHDKGEHPEGPEVVEEPARAIELEAPREERRHHEAGQPEQHLDRARLLEHHEDAIENHCDHQYVDGIAQPE